MRDRGDTVAFPCGKAHVLCSDERFAAAMAHELERMGVLTVVMTALPFALSETPSLVVADRDDLTDEAWEPLRERTACPWIFWSRRYRTVEGAVCLRRPFDLEGFARAVRTCLTVGDATAVFPGATSVEGERTVRVLRDGVLTVKNREVILTPYEWAVYQCLAEHRGKTVSRDTLRALLDGAGGNTVDVYVCHLRAKLEKPLGVRLITTVRGQGYRME